VAIGEKLRDPLGTGPSKRSKIGHSLEKKIRLPGKIGGPLISQKGKKKGG